MTAPLNIKTLAELKKGQKAEILSVEGAGEGGDLSRRLMEIGLLEGAGVELVHEAPFGGDPIAVRVRGALIALRRAEAAAVKVKVAND
jgi:ferrous iron transport protein A